MSQGIEYCLIAMSQILGFIIIIKCQIASNSSIKFCMHQSPPIPAQSSYIVSTLIQDTIFINAVNSIVPSSYVHRDSLLKSTLIQESITNLAQAQPDSPSPPIQQGQDLLRSPTQFRVRQESGTSPTVPSQQPHSIQSRYSNKEQNRKISYRVLSEADVQLSHQTQMNVSKKRSSREHLKINHRFLPVSSSHFDDDRSSFKYTHEFNPPKQDEYDNDRDVIKILRQNKLFLSSQNKNNKLLQKDNHVYKKESSRKLKDIFKQGQPKKCMGLTTNYEGAWVPITKGDTNRQVSHYIDVQAQIVEQKLQPSHAHVPDLKNVQLCQQFTNYKQLKFCERQNKFISTLYHNFWTQHKDQAYPSTPNINNHKVLPQKEVKRFTEEFNFSGQTFKPSKVGFNTFQKIKNNNWKIQKLKQNIKQESQTKIKIGENGKRQMAQVRIQEQKEVKGDKCKDLKANITLGNARGLHFLLYGDRKYLKKTVKINEEFL